MKNKALFMRRLQMTALFLMAYVALSSIPLSLVGESQTIETIFSRIASLNGASNNGLQLFSLGLMPYFMASLLLKVLTQGLSPTLSELSRGTQQQRKTFAKISKIVFYVIAVLQAYALVSMFYPEFKTMEILSNTNMLLVIGFLFVGALLSRFIAEQITAKGISNGFIVVISFMILRNIVTGLLGTWNNHDITLFILAMGLFLVLLVIAIRLQSIIIEIPVTIDVVGAKAERGTAVGVIEDAFRINLLCVGITPIIYLSFVNPLFALLNIESVLVLHVVSFVAIYLFTDMSIKSDFNIKQIKNIFLQKGIYLKAGMNTSSSLDTKLSLSFKRIMVLNTIVLFMYYAVGSIIQDADIFVVLRESRIDGVQILLLAYAIMDIYHTVMAYFVKDSAEILY